jgi:beta-lactam-binding protein with PASTA domain
MAKKTFIDYALYVLIYLDLFAFAATLSSQVIFRGELISLPNVIGKTLEEARMELAQKKTSLSIASYQFDNRFEKGQIIYQDPSAGSRLRANRTVKVIVSEGSESATVPRVEGRSLEWASQSLKTAGLRRGRVSHIHTPRYAAGRVIAQEPRPGETIKRNEAVDVLVSQGAWEPKYVMPDLIGRNATAVVRRLQDWDFKVADIHHSYYPGRGPGIVIGQSPARGFKIQKRSQITLEVSK